MKSSKQEKSPALTLAASHGSPTSQKKGTHAHVPKVKKESQIHSSKRPSVSDDLISKPKKKKIVDKHEHSNNITTSNPVLKDFPLLTPANDVDSVKAKSLGSSKKLKELRRRSTEDIPKLTTKENHTGKEVKVKKEKRSEKKVSPSGSDPGKESGGDMKLTFKRSTNASWQATPQNGVGEPITSSLIATSALMTTSTTFVNNSTTLSQQNNYVNRLMAEYAQQNGPSDDDNDVMASPPKDDVLINKSKLLKSTPDHSLLSSSISSLDSTGGELNTSSSSVKVKKSSKTHKSNGVKSKSKSHHREIDKK